MIWLMVFVFLTSCLILFLSGSRLVDSLGNVAGYLKWREFVVAFFIVAVAGALPNIFVGINAALQKIPELSLGDVVGGNVIDITLAIALAMLLSGNNISAESKMVQTSALFTVAIALLPMAMAWDNNLNRTDGMVLILAFIIYSVWLFSNEDHFKKIYKLPKKKTKKKVSPWKKFLNFLRQLSLCLFYIALILAASFGMVKSSRAFASSLGVPLSIIGILIVGLGNALPETYFSIVSARKSETWMILGSLMGSVIVCATFVLGIVLLICPINNINFAPFAVGRIFMLLSGLLFLLFIKTGKKITIPESVILLAIYAVFVFSELCLK